MLVGMIGLPISDLPVQTFLLSRFPFPSFSFECGIILCVELLERAPSHVFSGSTWP